VRPVLLAVLATLAVAPAAAATEPELRAPTRIESVRAYELSGDRVAVDVRVRHGTVSRRAVAVGHRHRLAHRGRVTVSAGRGIRGSSSAALLLTARGRSFEHTQRVVLRGAAGGPLRLVVRAADRVVAGGRVADRSRDRAARRVPVRALELLPPRPRPRCEGFPHRVPYGVRSTVAVVCMGDGVRVRVRRQPRRGRARIVRTSRGRALIALRPRARFSGRDSVVIEARSPGGVATQTLRLRVQQFAFRALGDSVTAGFGFVGNSGSMGSAFLSCIPPSPPNDRCSSNSSNLPAATGSDPGYLPDFGLGNGISWPAQFAKQSSITPAMYENRAVSGATPADWDPGGALHGQLETIVADSPNLTVLTLGANPLLDTFLEGSGLACEEITNPQLFRDCVQGFIDEAGLTPHLRSVLGQLLQAPANKVVVSLYHLALPSIALVEGWSTTQLESLFAILNSNVAKAVKGVNGYGQRLYLIQPPRFNTGLPGGTVTCPGQTFTVDGPSRQAQITQQTIQARGVQFCPSSEYWIISTDFGIHPTPDGYAQFAGALRAATQAHDLVPPLP
jgi:lysophospholipase L1-like esterase